MKLILRSAVPLPTNAEIIEETAVKDTPKKPPKLYLKVPSTDSKEFKRAVSFVGIFDEGNTPVLFYDSSRREYMRDFVLMCSVDGFIIDELCEILGRDNVVFK